MFGYYTQHTPPIPGDVRVIDYLREFAPSPPPLVAGAETADEAPLPGRPRRGEPKNPLDPAVLLEQFGFPRTRQHTL